VPQRCCWVDEALANGTLDVPALHEAPEDVRAWLRTWHATGRWLDGRLLGMVRTRRLDADWPVGRLCVVPDLRGKGLGRWLPRGRPGTLTREYPQVAQGRACRTPSWSP
jgi:GNAT superfamily N-acetyltransferase